jgi:glycerol-3-phosphate dehydrogenase
VQLADILHRRTMVGLSPALGLDVDREVAAVAAPLLGWADADVHEQVRRHRDYVRTRLLGGVQRRVPEVATAG